jgi:Fungal Zn(2)-Cys(6) binuclear cluster domain
VALGSSSQLFEYSTFTLADSSEHHKSLSADPGAIYLTYQLSARDAAQRHESAHVLDGSPSPSGGRTAIHPTCAKCAQARIKCSGLDPCQSCKNSGLECRYPARKKRRRVLSDADEQHGYAPRMSPEQAALEALAPEQQVPLTRSPLSSIVAGADFIPPAPSSSARNVVNWPSQPFNTASSNTSLEFRAESYPDEALISAIMGAPWTWTDAGASCAEHIQSGQTNALAGRRYFMPTGDTSLGQPGSDINWLPLDDVSEVYFESINATSLDSPITLPAFLSQGPQIAPPTSEIQQAESTLPVIVPPQSSPGGSVAFEVGKEAPSISQNTEHATLGEIENAVFPRRKRSLYVDGAGSRSTHAERSQPRKRFSAPVSKPPLHDSPLSPNTPNNSLHEILDEQVQRIRRHKRIQLSISVQTYKEIISKLENVFSWFSPTLHSFTSNRFPSIETLDWFVQLYFENFHPVYPFLDRSLLSVPSWGSCITLATAAIGANYMASPEAEVCSDALHGLLHEILTQEVRKYYPTAACWY